MLALLLTVLAVGLGLTALLWVGSVFLQGYFYTEPSPGMAWQAPAVGGGLTLFLMLWCVLNAASSGATAAQVPYDALHRFSSTVDYDKHAAEKLWSYKKGQSKPTEYARFKLSGDKYEYRIPDRPSNYVHPKGAEPPPRVGDPWVPNGVVALEIPDKNDKKQKLRFEYRKTEEPYANFVSEDGWVMKAEQNIGRPSAGAWGRFLVVVFLNLVHFGLWFAGLWLVLRYEWVHALGLAFVLWLVMTLTVLPMLLNQAGAVAESSTTTAKFGVSSIFSA